MHIFRHVPKCTGRLPRLGSGDRPDFWIGVHLGHQALLAQARREAEMRGRPLDGFSLLNLGRENPASHHCGPRCGCWPGRVWRRCFFLARLAQAPGLAENRFCSKNVLLKELDVLRAGWRARESSIWRGSLGCRPWPKGWGRCGNKGLRPRRTAKRKSVRRVSAPPCNNPGRMRRARLLADAGPLREEFCHWRWAGAGILSFPTAKHASGKIIAAPGGMGSTRSGW